MLNSLDEFETLRALKQVTLRNNGGTGRALQIQLITLNRACGVRDFARVGSTVLGDGVTNQQTRNTTLVFHMEPRAICQWLTVLIPVIAWKKRNY